MSAPWQWQAPEAPPRTAGGGGRAVAVVTVALGVIAVAMIGGLLAARSTAELGTADPRTLPGSTPRVR